MTEGIVLEVEEQMSVGMGVDGSSGLHLHLLLACFAQEKYITWESGGGR